MNNITGSGGNIGSSGGKNVVRGYTKKGKLFLDFDTNLTESIKSISISGSHLLVAGDHVYNHYVDCRDSNYFLSEDSISDVMALPGEKVILETRKIDIYQLDYIDSGRILILISPYSQYQ